jgi:NADP-dependent 3-hydroxy acid dehydrogenase YdfG
MSYLIKRRKKQEMAKKKVKVSEIRTTIYLAQEQHEILSTIALENKIKNQKRSSSKKKPESIAQLIRTAVNRCYINPYKDYHIKKKRYTPVEEQEEEN